MKVHLETDPKSGTSYWYSDDRRFYGAVLEPFALEVPGKPETRQEMEAGALLSVPKYKPHERPSINKHSPLIVQAPSVDELVPLLEKWVDENAKKKLWDLRT